MTSESQPARRWKPPMVSPEGACISVYGGRKYSPVMFDRICQEDGVARGSRAQHLAVEVVRSTALARMFAAEGRRASYGSGGVLWTVPCLRSDAPAVVEALLAVERGDWAAAAEFTAEPVSPVVELVAATVRSAKRAAQIRSVAAKDDILRAAWVQWAATITELAEKAGDPLAAHLIARHYPTGRTLERIAAGQGRWLLEEEHDELHFLHELGDAPWHDRDKAARCDHCHHGQYGLAIPTGDAA